jgi:hypothetical protein
MNNVLAAAAEVPWTNRRRLVLDMGTLVEPREKQHPGLAGMRRWDAIAAALLHLGVD